MDQFIDFCILCGCDYTGKISNIGPVRAFNMLQKEHNIEHVLGWIGKSAANKERYSVPEDFDHYTARNLFKNPVVMK
jgi:flap endonuclease-1